MARISLKEAYDNRDVIAWLVKHEDEIDELMNILKDIDPDGDLTNVVTKTGDQTIDGIKTFIGKIVADCDIIQNGGNYETHAEQVFTTNDYIVMRDGAVSGLGTGQYSGFQVKKYNGSDDGRLVIDNAGVARVGDLGDEQPLATRDEASSMTSGALVKWDGVNERMIAPASNVGSDSNPVKIVNGEAVPVTGALQPKIAVGRCRNVQTSVPLGVVTPITFSEGFTNDSDVIEVNNGVFTVKKAGIYHFFVNIAGKVTSSSRVELSLKRDGSSEYGYIIREITSTGSNQAVSADFVINESQPGTHTYQMEVWSESSALTTENAGTYGSTFNVIYLG